MSEKEICKYCKRDIVKNPFYKQLRNEKCIYCSEFCFRLDFYHIPDMDYEGLKDFYDDRTVSVPAPDFISLAKNKEEIKWI